MGRGSSHRSLRQNPSSELPRVLLQLNPGLGRQLEAQLRRTEQLKEKAKRTRESSRRTFAEEFELRTEMKADNAARRIALNMDEETRRAVDAIKAENR